MIEIVKGSVDQTLYFKLVDDTTGSAKSGLVVSAIDATYVRYRRLAVKGDVSAVAASADSAHVDNQGFEVDATNAPGLYRIDFVDAAFANSSDVPQVICVINHASCDPAMQVVGLVQALGGELGVDTITSSVIAANAITAAKFLVNAINASAIAADAIDASAIAAGAITAAKFASDAITASVVAAGAITAAKFASDAITASVVAADFITAAKIASDAIDSSAIAAGAITAAKFAAGAIDAAAIAADAIDASAIAANAITSAKFALNAINASAVSSSTVVTVGGFSTGQGPKIRKNAALTNFAFVMTDSTNHAPTTGLTVTGTRRIDGGAFAACANAVTSVANGWYTIDLDATDLNGDVIAVRFTATGADDLPITIVTNP